MRNYGSSFALVASAAALLAAAIVVMSPHEKGDHRSTPVDGYMEASDDFRKLLTLIEMETGERPKPDATLRPPAVATAGDVSDSDRAAILELVITDVLENPAYQHSRDFYGTPGRHSAVVLTDGAAHWPRGFKATVPKWNIEHRASAVEPKSNAARVVAIRFDKFALHEPVKALLDGHIRLCVFNGGGNPDGVVHIGGCFKYYSVSRRNNEWAVECTGGFDP